MIANARTMRHVSEDTASTCSTATTSDVEIEAMGAPCRAADDAVDDDLLLSAEFSTFSVVDLPDIETVASSSAADGEEEPTTVEDGMMVALARHDWEDLFRLSMARSEGIPDNDGRRERGAGRGRGRGRRDDDGAGGPPGKEGGRRAGGTTEGEEGGHADGSEREEEGSDRSWVREAEDDSLRAVQPASSALRASAKPRAPTPPPPRAGRGRSLVQILRPVRERRYQRAARRRKDKLGGAPPILCSRCGAALCHTACLRCNATDGATVGVPRGGSLESDSAADDSAAGLLETVPEDSSSHSPL